jgi:UDP-glucose 4-epimerase
MSFVVLGGGGFVGTNLCRRLVASGARVRAFGRSRAFADELAGVEWHQGEFTETAALTSAVAGCDVVFHLIQATTPHSPTDPITSYGIIKLTIEKFLALCEHLHGLSFRVLRVANPFGPFQLPAKAQGLVAMLLSRAMRGQSTEIWGDGSVVRDYVFIDDVVDALQAAAVDTSAERIFNIGSGRGHSVREVIAAVEAALGAPVPIEWRPGRAIDVPASVLSIGRARGFLDWAPKTEFAEGLRQTSRWWRARCG